mmetsp:Transcript_17792/g.38547  ORF Transcript_17792/g.38547 Transcript_17792/m.38547 type:complete len:499 (-) Transcript_17792:266-1762(-)
MPSAMGKVKVLVVGGGPAGMACAAALKRRMGKAVHITLVDKKEFFEVSFVTPRALVDPRVTKDLMMYSYEDFTFLDKVHKDEVVELHPNHAVLKKEHLSHVSFDFAVVCVGASYSSSLFRNGATTMAKRRNQLISAHNSLLDARHVVVVGGNFVGCEVAAELTELRTKPKVTIVHSHAALLHSAPAKSQLAVRKFFAKRGVHVVLNQRLERTGAGDFMVGSAKLEPGDYELTNGTVLTPKPDAVMWCTGTRPACVRFVEKGLGDCVVSKRDHLRVSDDLRLLGYANIFAIGDCNDIKQLKTANNAAAQGLLTASNITKLLSSVHLRPALLGRSDTSSIQTRESECAASRHRNQPTLRMKSNVSDKLTANMGKSVSELSACSAPPEALFPPAPLLARQTSTASSGPLLTRSFGSSSGSLSGNTEALDSWIPNNGNGGMFYLTLGFRSGLLVAPGAGGFASLRSPESLRGMLPQRSALLKELAVEKYEAYRKGRNDLLFY